MRSMNTPILLIVFNRPETTKQVFGTIKRQRPKYLYIAADGPRPGMAGDEKKCRETRDIVINNIDWDCEVFTLFHDSNLGCMRGPIAAITWFFNNVKEGIIIEDDCLPNDTFFRFCSILLKKYRFDRSISIISGNNFQKEQPMNIFYDYYFSVFPSTWGWATWKRNWRNYDHTISKWEIINKKFLKKIFAEKAHQQFWMETFDEFANHETREKRNTWDYQFYFSSWMNKQLAIIPKANMVSNIGHGEEATHTMDSNSYFANLPIFSISFPLKHPDKIERNLEADIFIQDLLFGRINKENSLIQVFKFFKKIVKRYLRANG